MMIPQGEHKNKMGFVGGKLTKPILFFIIVKLKNILIK